MDDSMTQSVLEYQQGKLSLDQIRNLVLVEAYDHLRRYRRKGEDEVSEFLLVFYDRIPGLLGRFRCQGLPFRHFLLRSLRWQWTSFRADRSRARRQGWLVADAAYGSGNEDVVAEPGSGSWEPGPVRPLTVSSTRRLVLLVLKAAPYLDDGQIEAFCRHTGTDLAWLQACQHRLKTTTIVRRSKRAILVEKRGEAFYRRLLAEDEAQREFDPVRRQVFERRAMLYRRRMASLTRQQETLSTAPTHLEVATLLGMPKGSVDSGLYHLKKELVRVYSGRHDDPSGHQQRPQKTRT